VWVLSLYQLGGGVWVRPRAIIPRDLWVDCQRVHSRPQ
jgi:hypothetical protein